MTAPVRPKENSLPGYIVGLCFGVAFLYALNRLPQWNVQVLTTGYGGILWAVNVSLAIQIALNLALIFYHPLFFHYLGSAVIAAAAIFGLAVVVQQFPFDFTRIPEVSAAAPWINPAARIVLLAAIAGSAIGVLVNVIKFFVKVFRGDFEG